MGERATTPEEVVLLLPEPVGSSGASRGEPPFDLGDAAYATEIDVELDVAQGLAPLSRAAETLLRQGKRYIVLDLSRFTRLKADELKSLVETRDRCARAHGALLLAGVQRDVAATMKLLELDKQLDSYGDRKAAADALRRKIEGRRSLERRLGELPVDVHVLPLGKTKGDESFLSGFRRKGPDGLSREVVVLDPDPKGVPKAVERVRAIVQAGIPNVILDLAQVPSLEGPAMKDLLKAQKLVQEKGGYMAIAGPREAVAGLLKVMGLDREITTHATREKAVEDFKEDLLERIEAKTAPAKPAAPEKPPAGAAAPAAAAAPAKAPPAKAAPLAAEAAKPPRLVEVVESNPRTYLFRRPGATAGAADTVEVGLTTLAVVAASLPKLSEAVKAAARDAKAVVIDLGAIQRADPAVLGALIEAGDAARAAGVKVAAAGASMEMKTVLKLMAQEKGVDLFDAEADAAAALAYKTLEETGKKAVRFRRRRVEVETDARPRTMMVAVPNLDEDEGEKKPQKTLQFAAPTFLDDDEGGSEKKAKGGEERAAAEAKVVPGAPDFDADDDAAPKTTPKTLQFAAPTFLDDDEAPGDTRKIPTPSFLEADAAKTSKIETPDFLDEPAETSKIPTPSFLAKGAGELAKGAGETSKIATPSFLEKGAAETSKIPTPGFLHKKPGETDKIPSPAFLDEDESGKARKSGKMKAAKGDKTPAKAEKPAAKPDKTGPKEKAPGGDDDRSEAKTRVAQAVPDFDDDEALSAPGPTKTQQFAAPTFLDEEDDESEKKPTKTQQFAAPTFLDEDEEEDEDAAGKIAKDKKAPAKPDEAEERSEAKTTVVPALPDFDEEADVAGAAKPTKTQQFAAPTFLDEEEDADEEKPQKTQTMQFAAPTFLDDEDEKAAKDEKTGKDEKARKADEEVKERRPKTVMGAVPNFDDDEVDAKKPRPGKTSIVSTPNFDEEDESKEKKATPTKEERPKTMLVSVPEIEAPESPPEGRGKTMAVSILPDDLEPEASPPEGRGKTMAISVLPDLEPDDAPKTTVRPAAKPEDVGGKTSVRPAAPAALASEGKTEMRPAVKPEEPATVRPSDFRSAKTEMRPAIDEFRGAKTEMRPAAKPDDFRSLKTEARPTPKLDDDFRGAKTEARPAAKPEDFRGAKTEARPAVKPEDFRGAKTEARPTPKFDEEQGKKTESRPAPRSDEFKVAKTEMRPAMVPDLGPGPEAKTEARTTPKTDEFKALKTEMRPAVSAEPSEAKTEARTTPKTDEFKALKTEMRPAVSAEPSEAKTEARTTPKTDEFKALKTEMRPAVSAEPPPAAPPAPRAPAPDAGRMKSARTEEIAAAGTKPSDAKRTEEIPAAAPKPQIKSARTELIDVSSLVEPQDRKPARTQPSLTAAKDETQKVPGAGPTPEGTQRIQLDAAKTERLDADELATEILSQGTPAAPPPAAKPAGPDREVKTQTMTANLSSDEALRIASEQTGKVLGVKKAATTDPEKPSPKPSAGAEDAQVRKTEVMPGLSYEEAKRRLEDELKKGTEPRKGDKAAEKPAETAAKPAEKKPGDIQAQRTEMMPGLSRDDALRRVKEEQAGKGWGATPPAKGEDLQARKTDNLPGLTKVEAEKKVGEDKTRAAKTEVMAGLTRAEAEKQAAEEKTRGQKTEMLQAPTRAEAEKAVRGLKTETMSAPTRAEAEKAVRGMKTETMSAPSRADAEKAVRGMKTEAMSGVSRDEAAALARKEAEGRGAKGGGGKEAVTRGSKTPLVAALVVGVALLGGAGYYFKFVRPASTVTTPKPKVETPEEIVVKKRTETLKVLDDVLTDMNKTGFTLD